MLFIYFVCRRKDRARGFLRWESSTFAAFALEKMKTLDMEPYLVTKKRKKKKKKGPTLSFWT